VKPVADTTRDETRPAWKQQEGLGRENLLEQALSRENMAKAWKRVKANKGSAGVDGLSIDQSFDYLKGHWPQIRSEIKSGTYRPQAVRRVEIPKPTGGKRILGIPTESSNYDALIAGLVEHVCQQKGVQPPDWVDETWRSTEEWYVSGIPELREFEREESPSPFAKRGVYLLEQSLSRA